MIDSNVKDFELVYLYKSANPEADRADFFTKCSVMRLGIMSRHNCSGLTKQKLDAVNQDTDSIDSGNIYSY